MNKFMIIAAVALMAASAFGSDTILKNSNGFYAKQTSNGLYYPAQVCFSTDGNGALVPCRAGGTGVAPILLDMSVSNVGAAYVQLAASTAAATKSVNVYNPSAHFLYLSVGGAGSEANKLIVGPSGWSGPYPLHIPTGSRIAVKSDGADVSTGDVLINLGQ